jgi:hypothetical protein
LPQPLDTVATTATILSPSQVADGEGHHFFDHARILLDEVLPAGTVVRLTSDARSQAWIAIDLVDFEMVPAPHRRPSRSLSVVEFGADPHGELDSREAFSKAIAAASGSKRPLWVPPGHYRLDGHVQVDHVEIAGAGPWYSVLQGDGVGRRRETGKKSVSDRLPACGLQH